MKHFIVAAVLAVLPMILTAQNLSKGWDAYNAGDYRAAMTEWRPLAEQGHVGAQYRLGEMFANGRGIPQDYTEARKWYELAADQDLAISQYALGLMYEKGNGVRQDYAEAVKRFRAAATAGDIMTFSSSLFSQFVPAEHVPGLPRAQYKLGEMYAKGLGVIQDHAEARRWYALAASRGDNDAMKRIEDLEAPVRAYLNDGRIYIDGIGVLQDYQKAYEAFKSAVELGSTSAQGLLGNMYRDGKHVRQSNVAAHMWYNIASANGDDTAREWRDERAGLMTSADISKAQEMARECMSSNYKNCGY